MHFQEIDANPRSLFLSRDPESFLLVVSFSGGRYSLTFSFQSAHILNPLAHLQHHQTSASCHQITKICPEVFSLVASSICHPLLAPVSRSFCVDSLLAILPQPSAPKLAPAKTATLEQVPLLNLSEPRYNQLALPKASQLLVSHPMWMMKAIS